MATRNGKSVACSGKKRGEVRLRGKRLPTLDNELAMVRTGPSKKVSVFARRSDEADVMVRKAGKALTKPGISKFAVFGSHATGKIFAYSVYSRDATKIVREASDGTRRIGRLVGGKFRLE